MLWFTTGCQPSLDAALAHADCESDPARRQAIGVQLADGGVTLGANSPALAPQLIDARTAHWHLVPPWLLGLGPLDAGHGRDGTAMPIDRGAKRTTKVMQEMPSAPSLATLPRGKVKPPSDHRLSGRPWTSASGVPRAAPTLAGSIRSSSRSCHTYW